MKMPGLTELVLILAIALIIFGPRKLPEIGRSIGRGIREFRSATTEVKKSVSLDVDEDEENEFKDVKKEEVKTANVVDTVAQEESVDDNTTEQDTADETENEEAKKEEQKV